MSSALELAPEVPCASSYGRFTAAKEFWSQCYILLLFIIYICFGWIYLNYVIDTHIYTHKLGHLVDPQGPFGGILTYLQSQGRMQIFAQKALNHDLTLPSFRSRRELPESSGFVEKG